MSALEKETPNVGPAHSFNFGSEMPAPGSRPIAAKPMSQDELAGHLARQPSAEEKAAVMATRRQRFEEIREREAGNSPDDENGQDDPPPPPNQRPRAIECVLTSNDMQVVYGPPERNLSLIAANILGVEDSRNFLKQMIVRTACCVQRINGKAYNLPTSWVQCAKIADILGERAIDELILLHDQYWPSIRKEDLPNVRLMF